jgi:hypothetical protein
MKRTYLVWMPMLAGAALLTSGCSITPMHKELKIPAQLAHGSVATAGSATGMPSGKVGWGRITLFAIPVAPVHVEGDASRDTMIFVGDALKTAGYTVSTVETGTHAPGPLLTVGIRQYKFNNYTWLAPLMFTWGTVELDATLRGADDQLLWTKRYTGKGTSLNITQGFTGSASKCMTRVLNQMVVDFSSPAFTGALLAGAPATRETDEVAAVGK